MVFQFPTPLDAVEHDGATCTIWYIGQRLGRSDYRARRMVSYVSLLISNKGFPQPFPQMSRDGTLIDGVTVRSTWPKPAVDTWLDNFLPPDATAALDAAARAAAAAEMDNAASSLGRGHLRVVGGRGA